ncbi:protein of unknown function (plasmid) [Azospirillum baldaniorum]|uniref:Uncharacterized protein n=1 Tax=Azospirillum baldaniorum TaxID=1064539 RepID=A0A9P1JVD3_9PROT|nr:protein of unknown function [Azospirillum baldaniorum]
MISVRSEVQILPGPPPIRRHRTHRHGGIAQLGERLLCKQEVVGSIPSASTRNLTLEGLVSRRWWSPWDPSEGNATRKRELRAPHR